MNDVASLVEELEASLGEDLRTVVEYDREGFEIRYRREDIDRGYVREAFEAFRDQVIVRQIGIDDAEGIRGGWNLDGGDDELAVAGVVYWTDRAAVVQVGSDRYRGAVISIEPSSDVPMGDLRDACAGIVEGG